MAATHSRHCEERSDEAIQLRTPAPLDCFASLAMTTAQA
jgi:mannose-1-phosphate guanylyltransferase